MEKSNTARSKTDFLARYGCVIWIIEVYIFGLLSKTVSYGERWLNFSWPLCHSYVG